MKYWLVGILFFLAIILFVRKSLGNFLGKAAEAFVDSHRCDLNGD